MSENNHIDDLMRSILENAQEEVPAHVWEGVSAGLDKAARRKTVVLWCRRAVTAVAAAAVVAGIILDVRYTEETIVPEASDKDMIAVVENVAPVHEEEADATTETTYGSDASSLMAYIPEPSGTQEIPQSHTPVPEQTDADEAAAVTENVEEDVPEAVGNEIRKAADIMAEQDEWEEDEKEIRRNRMKASLTISGIAGSNTPQSNDGLRPMRAPSLGRKYTKTTVEHLDNDIAYGIPFSAGIGVKLNFTKRWSLGMGVNYSLLTSRFNGKYIKVNEDGVEDLPIHEKISNSQHYIGIPINAYYNIVSHDFVNFYAYAGGAVEKCIANRYQVLTAPVINHAEEVKGVQLSVNAGIGAEFMLGRYVGIYLDPSIRYYFRNSQPKSIRTAQPLMLGFEVGLRFNL